MSDESESENGFGTANLDGNFENYKFFQLHEPNREKGEEQYELVVRLLPAMHSYRDTGEWNFYYGQHYGHYGVNKRNPEKPRARPFKCIQERDSKTKKILVACPKCTQIDKVKSMLSAREHELLQQLQASDSSITESFQEFKDAKKNDKKCLALGKWLRSNNCDRKIWINAMDRSGNFGVLKLSYTTFKDLLKPLLKKLRDQDKIDAFNPSEGRWLKFSRTGTNPNIKDAVEVFSVEVEVDVPGMGKSKVPVPQAAPMTGEQIKKALKVCPDLAKNVVKVIPVEIMQKLIDSSGDPEETDAIWPPEEDKGSSDSLTSTKVETKTETKVEAKADTTVKASETKVVAKAAEPEVDAEEAAALALIEKRKASRAAAAAAAEVKKTAESELEIGGASGVPSDPKKFLEQFGLE